MYKKDAELCVESLPALRFAMLLIFIELQCKTCEKTTIIGIFLQCFDEYSLHRKSETGN
jgi:hypothetical protein